MPDIDPRELRRRARIAGGLYVLTLVPGLFSLMYVPGALVVHGDAAATMARIAMSQDLLRWGVAGELAGAVLWILVTRALYRLLADVDRGEAWLMVALSLMAAPIMVLDVMSEVAVLAILGDAHFAAAFTGPQVQAIVGLLMRSHGQGLTVAGVFWGLWLFPFAALVWRSRFLPRFLAPLLVIGGLGYLASSFSAIVAPALSSTVQPAASIATSLGELPIMIWLLVVGARRRGAARA